VRNHSRKRLLPFGAALWIVLSICFFTAGRSWSLSPPALIDYDRQVHAILAEKCLACHNAEKRSGGLSLANYQDVLSGGRTGAAVKPGSSATSLVVKRITGAIQPRMPFGGDALADSEIALIRSWIDQGARATPASAAARARWDPPLALSAPPVPNSLWKGWTDPVDRFTARYLVDQKVRQPSLVSDGEFLRRAYLDIWGLLPDPAQSQEFLKDTRPDKRGQLVAKLLADNTKYSENWISYWNDLLRNDEGVAYYSDTAARKSITGWLLNALESNEPYNQMITELLNPTKDTDPDGFLVGVNWRGTVSASQAPAMQASQNTAQIFLGINFKCNSCHDSFISKWKLKDAYALASYFSKEEKLQLYRCDVAQEGFATAAFLYPELDRPLPSYSLADRRATAAAVFTDPRNGRMPRTLVNRIWEKLMGRGIVENVDDMDGEPWSPELLDWLSSEFVASGYDLKHLIGTIVSSRTYQLPTIARTGEMPKQFSFRGPELRRLTAEQFADAIAAITGDWHVTAPRGNGPGGGAGVGANGPGPRGEVSGAPLDGSNAGLLAAGISTGRGGGRGGQPGGRDGQAGGRAGQAGGQAGLQPGEPQTIPGGEYAREWKIAGSSLTRAMGRPIRDQVFSTRETIATTVQALELVNGETLTHWLWRGSRRMLGELPPEPASLFRRQVAPNRTAAKTPANDAAANNAPVPLDTDPTRQAGGGRGGANVPVPFNIEISKSQKLYLIVEDNGSTSPDQGAPIWLNGMLVGPSGSTPLTALTPVDASGLREDTNPIIPSGATDPVTNAVRVKFPSVVVYDIAGKGFTRFQGAPAMENPVNNAAFGGGTVSARFFVFDQKPNLDRLSPPKPETPLPPGPVLKTIPETVDRVYWYALGRAPSAAERQIAEGALRDPSHPGKPSADGLADLLWAVTMTPEFQFVR